MNELVTENELAQARNDPVFRQQVLVRNLARLLEALKMMRRSNSQDPETELQIKEGANLAVKIADRLQSGDRGLRTRQELANS